MTKTIQRNPRRRGMALVLVVAVVAIATVLGFAMLSGAMLQSRASTNAEHSVTAEYLAESGINLAMYYLQYPAQAPSLNAQGYWAGTSGDIAISSSIDGTVRVTVVQDSTYSNAYEVTAIGKAGSISGTAVTRTEYARLYVKKDYLIGKNASFNGNVTLYKGTTVDGTAAANGTITFSSTATVTGNIWCSSYSYVNGGSYSGQNQGLPSTTPSPTNTDVNTYASYFYQNATYSASSLGTTTTLSGTSGVTTKGTSTSNPVGIWTRTGDLTLGDNVTIDGTLVVNGNLTLFGSGVIITPHSGFPALVVTGNLIVKNPDKATILNGVCYVGGQMQSTGLVLSGHVASSLTINGGLLVGASSTPISSSYNATTYVKLDTTKNKAPDLSSANRTTTGVSVLRWGPVVSPAY